jgi:hypothetical protein
MKKILLSTVLFVVSNFLLAQETASGFVFEDVNKNGRKERREKGIEGVAVSNGVQVVQSNEKGEYELPVGEDQIIFVIKPSDYQVQMDENNLARFYYNHKPKGSPNLKFPGVQATGNLPKSIDFALIPGESKDIFTSLIFGDPQPNNMEEMQFFEDGVVSEVEGIKGIDFGLSLGDLVWDDLALFPPYIQAVSKVGIPWYNVLGNHDLNFDVEDDHLSDETFEAYFGPSTYAFNQGKVHFIVLNDVRYPDPRDGEGYWGGFRNDDLEFVKNSLAHVPNDHLIVLAMHIPLSEPGAGDTFRDEDREKLFELLGDFPHTLSLSAHTHLQRQDFFYEKDGWEHAKPHHHYNVGTTSGDWHKGILNEKGIPVSTMRDGTPKGYAFIDFVGNEYNIRYKVVDQVGDYQMEIFAPKVVEKDQNTSAGIYVNFFMGTSGDEVKIRVDKGEWKKMNFLEDYDPSYLVDLFQWDTSDKLLEGRRPSNPQKSTHLWRSQIPTNLEPGSHQIEVVATDFLGNQFTATKTYLIVGK